MVEWCRSAFIRAADRWFGGAAESSTLELRETGHEHSTRRATADWLARARRDRRGLAAPEYALLISAITVVSALSYKVLGRAIEARSFGAGARGFEGGNGGAGGAGDIVSSGSGAGAGSGGNGALGGLFAGGGSSSGNFHGGTHGGSTHGGSTHGGSTHGGSTHGGSNHGSGNHGSGNGGSTCGRSGGCGPGSESCFVAGTQVLSADGGHAIEAILPGDLVLARDDSSSTATSLEAGAAWIALPGDEGLVGLDPWVGQGGFSKAIVPAGSATVHWVDGGARAASRRDRWLVAGGSTAIVDSLASIVAASASRPTGGRDEGRRVRRVLATMERYTEEIVSVRTAAGTVETTPEHPFFVHGEGWRDAGSLAPDDRIDTAPGDATRVLEISRRHVAPTKVFNLTVEGSHTYFVGPDGLWVHNTCTSRGTDTSGTKRTRDDQCPALAPEPNLDYKNPASWSKSDAEALASYLHDKFYSGSPQSYNGTTVAVGVHTLKDGTVVVVVTVNGDSWGGSNMDPDKILGYCASGKKCLGNQPPPAVRAYLEQHGLISFRDGEFHAETKQAEYQNMNQTTTGVLGVSRPMCRNCQRLMAYCYGLDNVGDRQDVPKVKGQKKPKT